jgi:Kdo2-lipid IVA lauroyltransferase/acyltransferase
MEYWLVRFIVFLFKNCSFSTIYRLSDGLRWLLFEIFGYRKKVVFENLLRSFPEKSEVEINEIARKFYQNLCDITLEGFKGLSLSREELMRRYRFTNPEVVNNFLKKNKAIILTGMHYNNWEWGVLSFSLWIEGQIIGIYKPLTNRRVELFLNKKRGQWGMELCHPKDTRTAVEKYKNQAAAFILMADQSPSNAKTAQWISFLNQPTACIHGVETVALAHDLAVWQFEVERVGRGFYEIKLTPVCLEPSTKKTTEITADYMAGIEKIIKRKPENWLWSHKRWKIMPA